MAWRQKPRSFGNVGNRQFGIMGKQTFRIIDAKAGDPIAERCAIRRVDVLGQIGAVGMKHVRKLLYGQAGLNKTVSVNPPFDFSGYLCMVKRSVLPLCLFRLMITLTVIFRSHLRYHRVFHLLVKQQIVLVATVEIDVKRNR